MVFLKAVIEAVFRVLFTYDAVGEEHVPATGGAVIAANHPSYLDPILLSLQVPRAIHFMAWDALFRVPLIGSLIRAFGAFPVDIRKGQGHAAYAKARQLVEGGAAVGIFPEGKRSRTGWMEPTLRAGAARLAWELGAPLVPATITGAFRAWPYFRALPRATRIRVRFHEAIDPRALRHLPVDDAVTQLLDELRRRVDRTLLPGVKADLRTEVLYASPAARPRLYEWLPAAAAGIFVVSRGGAMADLLLPAFYLAYLALDRPFIPQSRLAKRLRNASAAIFALAYVPTVLRVLGASQPVAPEALLAVIAGASLAYIYERGRTTHEYVAGFVSAVTFGVAAQVFYPSGVGAHVALPAYMAAFAYQRRTVFWPWSVGILAAYAAGTWVWLYGGWQPWPHLVAGLLGWATARGWRGAL